MGFKILQAQLKSYRWLMLRQAHHEGALLGAILLVLIWPLPAGAAICPPSLGQRIASSDAGPYAITVTVQPPKPVIGELRLAVTVCEAIGNAPVEHAAVSLTPVDAAGAPGRPALAFIRGGRPEEYTADLNVKTPGFWRYRVHVAAPQGEADLEVPLDVRPPGELDPAAGMVFAGISAVLLAGGAYVARAASRRRVSTH